MKKWQITRSGKWNGWQQVCLVVVLVLSGLVRQVQPVRAVDTDVLGIHLLSTGDLTKTVELFKKPEPTDNWRFVTIPFSLEDTRRLDEWQRFFKASKEQRIIPIIRLVTRFERGNWAKPSRYDIVALAEALNTLEWPTEERYVIVFNEVNHAKEWGGRIDPVEYAEVLAFTSQWFKSNSPDYKILPAAMDLAAPDGKETRSAFNYFDGMLAAYPDVFREIDYWNSHSYPNPGFSAPPYKKSVNSLWGFGYELAYVKDKAKRDMRVFITETGWANNTTTRKWLGAYYTYALQHIWSDPRVVAVTPFVLKGDPGPFAEFGFIDRNDQPTVQYRALQEAMIKAAN